jgi:hypothetical protein
MTLAVRAAFCRRSTALIRASNSRGLNGLARVIVGAHLEAEDAIDVLAVRGQHDDRGLRLRADLAAQAEAVLAGQHDVENQRIDAMVGHGADHFAARRSRR